MLLDKFFKKKKNNDNYLDFIEDELNLINDDNLNLIEENNLNLIDDNKDYIKQLEERNEYLTSKFIDDDKDYIKQLEERNQDLTSKLIESFGYLNEHYERELESFERVEKLRRLNTSLEIENKCLKSKIEDLNKDIDLNKMFRNLDKRLDELNEYLKSKDVILNDNDDDKEEHLDPKSMILKLITGKDKDIYKNPKFKVGFNVLKISQDTNLSQFNVYKYLKRIKEDML